MSEYRNGQQAATSQVRKRIPRWYLCGGFILIAVGIPLLVDSYTSISANRDSLGLRLDRTDLPLIVLGIAFLSVALDAAIAGRRQRQTHKMSILFVFGILSIIGCLIGFRLIWTWTGGTPTQRWITVYLTGLSETGIVLFAILFLLWLGRQLGLDQPPPSAAGEP